MLKEGRLNDGEELKNKERENKADYNFIIKILGTEVKIF